MPRRGQLRYNLEGQQFGCFTVLGSPRIVYHNVDSGERSQTEWLCRCQCGCELYIPQYRLLRGVNKWCTSCRPTGVRNEPLYHVYHGILQRCYNTNSPSYAKYGARGIKVCASWLHSYSTFREWAMTHGYVAGLTIDRIDASGDYDPANCRWISLSENSARANVGRQKNHSKLIDMYAISADGERIPINNMLRFATEHSLCYSTVAAIMHGRANPYYHGWVFHSNKTRELKV